MRKPIFFLIMSLLLFVAVRTYRANSLLKQYEGMANSTNPEIQLVYYFTEIGKIVGPCTDTNRPRRKCICAHKNDFFALTAKVKEILDHSNGSDFNQVARAITHRNDATMESQSILLQIAKDEQLNCAN